MWYKQRPMYWVYDSILDSTISIIVINILRDTFPTTLRCNVEPIFSSYDVKVLHLFAWWVILFVIHGHCIILVSYQAELIIIIMIILAPTGCMMHNARMVTYLERLFHRFKKIFTQCNKGLSHPTIKLHNSRNYLKISISI